jgi:hypothetical protein
MDEKINVKAIDHYSSVFASKLADSFYQKKGKISGPEILALSEIKQINLLVVKELMGRWNSESEKWKSPYFEYESPEVQQSMAQFRNALSNHISIGKNDFLPLLKIAVAQTLYLLFAPYDFYADVLDSKGKGLLRVDALKNETRYLKINKAPLEKLVEKLEERKAEVITGNEAFALLDHILEEVNFTPEDVDVYITSFSKLVPLRWEELFEVKSEPVKEVVKVVKTESRPTQVVAPRREETIKKDFRIKDSLTINQKFMFTKILFYGDFEIFSEAIDRFDNFDNLQQAQNFINENYPQWDKKSEEFEEFFEILRRKFSA